MDNLTQDEIEQISKTPLEYSDNTFCLFLVNYMRGYLRSAPMIENETLDDTRQVFFKQIKRHLDGSRKASDDATRQGKIWGGQLLGWTTQKEIDALEKSIKTDY